MTLPELAKQLRAIRSKMPRLTSAEAYAQMDRMMGRTTSASSSVSGMRSSDGLKKPVLLLPVSFAPPAREGGREHDVRLEESTGRWINFTKPGANRLHDQLGRQGRAVYARRIAGGVFAALGLAKPSLRRQHPFGWTLASTGPPVECRDLGSQVCKGIDQRLMQLEDAFRSNGFALLPWRSIGYEGALAFRGGGFDVRDVHPANVFLSAERLPLPVDVIITRTVGDDRPKS